MPEYNEDVKLAPYKGSKRCKTIEEYLRKYFKKRCPATYYSNGGIQCLKSKNRSFTDLYNLVLAKFDKATKYEVASILMKLQREKDSNIEITHCCTIDKVVFSHTKRWYTIKVNKRRKLKSPIIHLDAGGYRGYKYDIDFSRMGVDRISINTLIYYENKHEKSK